MKQFLMILLLCYVVPVLAGGKQVDMSFEFKGTDAYSGKSAADVTIGIYTMSGEKVYEGKTNEKGICAPKISMDPVEYEVHISDAQDRYVGFTYTFWVSKKWDYHSMNLDLYPSKTALDAQLAVEDSIYGAEKTGDLSPEKNNSALIYGCSMEDLGDAMFPENLTDMQKFIATNIRYPEVSIESGEQGRVYAKFIIETDGSISHIVIERGVSPLLDGETVRVIRSMPKWTPATCEGKPVRSIARLPVVFRLM
ncbi:MAG: energy transducer TonB [Bacteroidetes bacterium]|nr:MAG: energy transducer TonB [Bacteroidota bacterium]